MGASERRNAIMRLLCRRRHETVVNIAAEFGVSERTIRRDIEILSLSEPIYTQSGRYGGGVYVTENYSMDRMYFTDQEAIVFMKLIKYINTRDSGDFSADDIITINNIAREYIKPNINKKEKNDYA